MCGMYIQESEQTMLRRICCNCRSCLEWGSTVHYVLLKEVETEPNVKLECVAKFSLKGDIRGAGGNVYNLKCMCSSHISNLPVSTTIPDGVSAPYCSVVHLNYVTDVWDDVAELREKPEVSTMSGVLVVGGVGLWIHGDRVVRVVGSETDPVIGRDLQRVSVAVRVGQNLEKQQQYSKIVIRWTAHIRRDPKSGKANKLFVVYFLGHFTTYSNIMWRRKLFAITAKNFHGICRSI